MTRIFFDSNGRPTWRNVDTAKFMHELNKMQNPAVNFLETDMKWFRKPLERSE